ncbi:MAG: MORN repeat variant [Candidatus Aerophobetes bacterium ADurb.Bin490]|nr:MAG: MORN repeat variant [Candidatus Aerophobetes bacterium ADurb.Bin490]
MKINGAYNNGKQEGLYKMYYPSGQVQVEQYFEAGKSTGNYTSYFENGKVKLEGVYADGELTNVSKYNEDGSPA